MRLLDKARNVRNQTERAAQYLPDEIALTSLDIYPKWGDISEYVIGNRVLYHGILYKCLQDHSWQNDWNPTDAPSLWAAVLTSDDGTALPWVRPDSTNPYQIGDLVIHNNKMWESIVSDNVWEPGVYGWVEVENDTVFDGDSSSEDSDSDTTSGDDAVSDIPEWEQRYGHNPYMTGDRVLYNGYVYESTFDGNTYSPDTYPAGWKLIS